MHKKLFSDFFGKILNRRLASKKTAFTPGEQEAVVTLVEEDESSKPPQKSESESNVGADCVVGKVVKLGNNCVIKKSVVGRHCQIGDNVRIVQSIILDHVTILAGTEISNCVIGPDAHIGDSCSLKNLVVDSKSTIPPKTKK